MLQVNLIYSRCFQNNLNKTYLVSPRYKINTINNFAALVKL